MTRNLSVILGVEALCGAQGIEFRAPLRTSPRLARVLARIRAEIPPLGQDRLIAPDMERAAALIREGAGDNAIKAEARKAGMVYLTEDGLRQVIQGKTSIDELMRVVK